ncbi:tripartite motif-containing protein 16-like protein [Kryptolebias marmoratus]|uniref:tripartite motif-containing protein 16-like protein n=1 Tax=Kryptolebias marmoratus TaxID=37003 RepID=UPI0007F8DD39|nr:tripartite motif-containing protein 16-like protein [Kryptolebias marmoratus]
MAGEETQKYEEEFCCSICLELLKDPVTIPCGHNYCMSCIQRCWGEEDQKQTYSCPQCKRKFKFRPSLQKNYMLAEAIEQLGKLQTAPHHSSSSQPVDLDSDAGTERKSKIICSSHKKVTELFCRTHRQCICTLCCVEGHKGHDVVSPETGRTELEKELHMTLQKVQQTIQDRERDVRILQQEKRAVNCSADVAVKKSGEVFTELINLLKKRHSDVEQQIRSQQTAAVSQIQEFEGRLEQEITQLRRTAAELEQLSNTNDDIHFLQSYSKQLPKLNSESVTFKSRRQRYFENVTAAVKGARERLRDALHEEWTKISKTEAKLNVFMSPEEPQTRAEFLQHSSPVTLDPNTAHRKLMLSEGNRKATRSKKTIHSKHPDRFTDWLQALSRESFTGCCYWEVRWRGRVSVAVAYRSIGRAGEESDFGNNKESWALDCYSDSFVFKHDKIQTSLSGPQSSTVGVPVYVDHKAGILLFLSVSDTTTVLHRVQTTFSQPLHAGLWVGVYNESEAEFCQPQFG